eukprot:COSAG01_NODE_13122_length_1632_cov_6.362218_1_plen_84_part_01
MRQQNSKQAKRVAKQHGCGSAGSHCLRSTLLPTHRTTATDAGGEDVSEAMKQSADNIGQTDGQTAGLEGKDEAMARVWRPQPPS